MKNSTSCRIGLILFNSLLWIAALLLDTKAFAQRIQQTSSEIVLQQSGSLNADLEQEVRETLKENAATIRFMENMGQLTNSNVLYYAESMQGSIYVERNQIRFVANEMESKQAAADNAVAGIVAGQTVRSLKSTHTFTLYLDGANADSRLKLGDAFSTSYNFFLSESPSMWRSSVKAAKELIYENVYPGIDLRMYSDDNGTFEFDWIVKAGADYSQVKMKFEGQDNIQVNTDGSLKVGLRFTDITFRIPEAYQVIGKNKQAVDFAFNAQGNVVTFFSSSAIDTRYPLVIDPTLSWGTFMDGNLTGFDQYLFAIQVDSDGKVYCAGGTNQVIPTNAAPYDANGYLNSITGFSTDGTPRVAIVYRVSADGSDLIDLTLYGPSAVVNNSGSGSDTNVIAYGLSLSANNVFVCGKTNSDLPTTGSPFDATRSDWDGFVAVFPKDLG
ncbi:MAG: hypothetical protein ACKVOR_13315, partial [Flavobacteriales bacterium]